jgi:Fe-S cluster biogenesis protein NfuA
VGVPDLHAVADRIEALLDELRSAAEGRVWLRVEELVRLLTELYGAGMARTLELADSQPDLIARLGRDELVGSLLVLHDLHPDSLEQRVHRALDSVAPKLAKGGASVEVTSLDGSSAEVVATVTAPSGGCGSTGETLCDAVRQALDDAAADATIEVRLSVDTTPAPTPVRLGRKPVGAAQSP